MLEGGGSSKDDEGISGEGCGKTTIAAKSPCKKVGGGWWVDKRENTKALRWVIWIQFSLSFKAGEGRVYKKGGQGGP